MKSIKGLAYATLLPGSAAITATLVDGGVVATASAELCVDCWEYPHIRQNAYSPAIGTDWTDKPYAMKTDANGVATSQPRTQADLGTWWTGEYLGYRYSISNKGCHMVSAAMLLSATTGTFINPADLNEKLQNNNGYDGGNGPIWSKIQDLYPNANINSIETGTVTSDMDVILQNCDMAIISTGPSGPTVNGINGPHPTHPNDHYIIVVRGENNKYKIYDPWIIRNNKGVVTENLVQLDNLYDVARALHFRSYIGIKLNKIN